MSFTPEGEFDNFEITYPKFSLNGTAVVDVDGGSSLGTINANFAVDTNPWSPLNGFDYIAPDLTTISDYVGLLSLVIEKAQLTGDVQLVSGIPYNGVTSTDGTHNAIVASMKLLAEQYGCAFVDLNARWRSFSLLNPLGYYDPATDYASRSGQYDIAAIVLEDL